MCSSAQDILEFYSQMRPDKIVLEQYPVATTENQFSAKVFYTLKALKAEELSDVLLFETAENHVMSNWHHRQNDKMGRATRA
ncbi:thioredoxin fold protein [Rodentibacter pneumotropicus]|uniref:Thioredoxin fold protein n=1 Tax=Rodentibacter pneumotropicus TaxID=758 RepID=A0A448MN18_9PAST|nr:thioredoxin fold protein [Rodentibacter pneumotropicus]